jgi:hypothetical protein
MSSPANPLALIGRRSDRRELEDTAPVVDEVEVASRILAEGRGIVDRPGIDRQLRGAVGGDPGAAIEAQREKLALNEIREEILPLQRLSLAAIDIPTGNRLPDRVVVGIDGGDERTGIADGVSPRIGDRPFNSVPAVVGALLAEIDLFPFILTDIGDVKISERAVEAWSPRVARDWSIERMGVALAASATLGLDGLT